VAGVIKMVLALRHGELPKTLHVQTPTPEVDWSSGAVALLDETTPWPAVDRPRRAGVSSFGYSGTNAHVILEQAPDTVDDQPPVPAPGEVPDVSTLPPPFVLSARTAAAVPDQARAVLNHLLEHPELDLLDVGYSLAARQPVLPYRAAVVGADRDELLAGLRDAATGEVSTKVTLGRARAGGRTAFLFPGQGVQRAGLGRELYQEFPAFARAVDAASDRFDQYLGTSLREVMFADDGSVTSALLAQTMFTQAAVFTMEVGLYRLLESWGQRPDVLLGHSVGEIAVAHVAGVLSLEDAVKLIANRGQLMQEMPTGAVVAVEAATEEITPLLGADVDIAAINGPTSVVVSGAEQPVLAIAEHFRGLGRRTSRLDISAAVHSPLLDDMLDELLEIAEELTYDEPRIPVVSTVTGAPIGAELCAPGYWVDNCRNTVRFHDAVLATGATRYVEIGLDGALAALAQQGLADDADQLTFVPVLRKDRSEVVSVRLAAGALFTVGAGIDPMRWCTGRGANKVPLPDYAFHRTRYWPNVDMEASRATGDLGSTGLDATKHPLLGAAITVADSSTLVLTGALTTSNQPWLADYVVDGVQLFPGAGFVELAVRAGDEAGCGRLVRLTQCAPLVLTDAKTQVQVVVGGPDDSGVRPVSIHARRVGASAWTCHATGLLSAERPTEPATVAQWPPAGAQPVDVADFYAGSDHGRAFHGLRAAWRRDSTVFAEVSLEPGDAAKADRFGLHPAVLDSALHAINLSTVDVENGLPAEWAGVTLYAAGATGLRVTIVPRGDDTVAVELADQTGAPVASIESLVLRTAEPIEADEATTIERRVVSSRRTAARASTSDTQALRGQLVGLTTEQQDKVLREFVVDHAATLLGYGDADVIDQEGHFLEAGFDSLTAVELRNSINAATGLRLPASVVFDHQTPAGLAAHLRRVLVSGQGDTGSATAESDGLKQLFAEAVLAGKVEDGIGFLAAAANLRPSFTGVGDLDTLPTPVRLADGPDRPRLLCVPPPAAMGGVYQYAKLAAPFRGRRGFSALAMPGFADGELLPATIDAAVEVLAASVLAASADEPVALLGYSSGGVLAYAVAGVLERSGHQVAGVVLLDTYEVDEGGAEVAGTVADMAAGMLEREEQYGPFDRAKLTAMARYLSVLDGIELTDISAPTVLLRPENRFTTAADDPSRASEDPSSWQTTWTRADRVITVPGDHFSLVEASAATTAEAVHNWLESR
jgi:acyl transferase domain-containing protein/thioesterase domain-containing protein/acyl carrier protein